MKCVWMNIRAHVSRGIQQMTDWLAGTTNTQSLNGTEQQFDATTSPGGTRTYCIRGFCWGGYGLGRTPSDADRTPIKRSEIVTFGDLVEFCLVWKFVLIRKISFTYCDLTILWRELFHLKWPTGSIQFDTTVNFIYNFTICVFKWCGWHAPASTSLWLCRAQMERFPR